MWRYLQSCFKPTPIEFGPTSTDIQPSRPSTIQSAAESSFNRQLLPSISLTSLPSHHSNEQLPDSTFNLQKFAMELQTWVEHGDETENRIDAQKKMLEAAGDQRKKTVSLDNLNLKSLPDCIVQLTWITNFSCKNNQLRSLPTSISLITQLEKLYCSYNQLNTLPESLSQITKLNYLSCSHNKLIALPETLFNLTKLKYLDCSHNQLISLPKNLFEMVEMNHLDCSHNRLNSLPKNINQLKKLTNLICSNNHISILPKNFFNMKEIKFLDISKNRLTTLPIIFAQTKKLNQLNCSHNNLTYLPENLDQLTNLAHLDCSSNPMMHSFPASITQLPATCTVYCDNNQLPNEVILSLQRAIELIRQSNPEIGPQIEYSMPILEPQVEKPLAEEIQSWLQETHDTRTNEPNRQLEATIQKANLDALSAQALSNLFSRLRSTAHYRINPEDLKNRVRTVLEQIKNKPEIMTICAAQAVEATETCDDRIALAFFLMEDNLLTYQAMAKTTIEHAQELKNIGIGLLKSELLRGIADKKAKTVIGFLDHTEIILKYLACLSKELNLPHQINDMIFYNCAHSVSEKDISDARKIISAVETDEKQISDYLAKWAPWQNLLKHTFPEQHKHLENELNVFLDFSLNEIELLRNKMETYEKNHNHIEAIQLRKQIEELSQELQQKKVNLYITLNQQLSIF